MVTIRRSKTTGQRIRELRELAGLSAKGLDSLAGLTPGHTRLIETRARDKVSAHSIVAIARVLGTNAEWLIAGDDDARPTARKIRAAVEAARVRQKTAA